MDMMLKEKQIAFVITTVCTLNCKYCSAMVPRFKESGHCKMVPLEQIRQEIAAVFKIYDYIEDVTISGGEPLLHPALTEIVSCFMSFEKQFNALRIFTNGTIIPKQELLTQIKQYGGKLMLVIDDYGPDRSTKVQDIAGLFEQNELPLRVVHYWGDNQHCGGWINLGSPEQYRGYSDMELESMYKNCHYGQYKCITVFNGKMVSCGYAIFGYELGLIPSENSVPDGQIIDLLDTSISLDKKRQAAAAYGKTPLLACQYCNGFDSEHGERIPAGEQK